MKLRASTIGLVLSFFLLNPASGFAEGEKVMVDKEEYEQLKSAVKFLMSERKANQKAVDDARMAAEQAAASAQQAKENAEQSTTMAKAGEGWFNNIEISGLTEVEVGYNDPDEGDSTSDIVLATQELGVAAEVTDWVSAEAVFLFEEDDTDLEFDVASVTIANPNGPLFATGGMFYVPFGTFETNLVSDPLTLEIGEIRESSVLAGFESNGFTGGVYVFNGDLEKDGDSQIDSFGAFAGYAQENENTSFAFNIGYINDIGDTDTLQDTIQDNIDAAAVDYDDHVGGLSLDGMFAFGPFTLIGEYLMATDEFEFNELAFEADGAEPEAFNIELGYNFNVGGFDMTAAVAYQGTDEAVALELPEERILFSLSAEIFDGTALSIEWAHDDDYSDSEGGTDEVGGTTITSQLAVEF